MRSGSGTFVLTCAGAVVYAVAGRGGGWLGLAAARAREALDLPPVDDDRLAALHAAAADERYRPVSGDGAYAAMLRT